VEKGGLKLLTTIIQKTSNFSEIIRTEALKAIVNLSLTGTSSFHLHNFHHRSINILSLIFELTSFNKKTIPVLVAILSENNTTLQEFACLTLENLSLTRIVLFLFFSQISFLWSSLFFLNEVLIKYYIFDCCLFEASLVEQMRLAGITEPLEKMLRNPSTQEHAAKLLLKLSANSIRVFFFHIFHFEMKKKTKKVFT
jgi:hypothetical protein